MRTKEEIIEQLINNEEQSIQVPPLLELLFDIRDLLEEIRCGLIDIENG